LLGRLERIVSVLSCRLVGLVLACRLGLVEHTLVGVVALRNLGHMALLGVVHKLGHMGVALVGRSLGHMALLGVGRKLGHMVVVVVGHMLGHMVGPLGHRILAHTLGPLGPLGALGALGPFHSLARKPLEVRIPLVGRRWGRTSLGRRRVGPLGERMVGRMVGELEEAWSRQRLEALDLIRIPLLAQPQPLELGWGVLEVLVLVG